MPGRGRVDDDAIVAAAGGQARDFEEGGELVDPWEGQPQEPGDVVLIQPGASHGDPLEDPAACREPSIEGARCVDLDAVERLAAEGDSAGGCAEAEGERIAERRRRIG
jgi:hypothetical protein